MRLPNRAGMIPIAMALISLCVSVLFVIHQSKDAGLFPTLYRQAAHVTTTMYAPLATSAPRESVLARNTRTVMTITHAPWTAATRLQGVCITRPAKALPVMITMYAPGAKNADLAGVRAATWSVYAPRTWIAVCLRMGTCAMACCAVIRPGMSAYRPLPLLCTVPNLKTSANNPFASRPPATAQPEMLMTAPLVMTLMPVPVAIPASKANALANRPATMQIHAQRTSATP